MVIWLFAFSSCRADKASQQVNRQSKREIKHGQIVEVESSLVSKISSSVIKRVYSNNKNIYLKDYKCNWEFCLLYVVKNKKVVQTKVFVKDESVEIELDKEGIYYIKLVKRDNMAPKELSEYDYKIIYDKSKPVLAIKTLDINKKVFKGGDTVKICYSSYDKYPKYVNAWMYNSLKKTTEVISNTLPKKGCINYNLPNYSSVLDFYFKLQDKAGNFSSEELITIFVDAEAPDLDFKFPDITNNQSITIRYTTIDRGWAGFDYLELWVSSPGKDWQKAGNWWNFKDTISYNLGKEGIYKFILKSYDKVGNVKVSNEQTLIFDQTSPKIKVEGFDKSLYYPQDLVKLNLEIEDDNLDSESLKLFLSANLGKKWENLDFQKQFNTIIFRISDLSTKNAILRLEVKDKAGNIGSWESNIFSIDNIIPVCEIVGDAYEFNKSEFELKYQLVKEGFKQPDKLKIIYKNEGETELRDYSFVFNYGQPLRLKFQDGKYRVGIICENTELEKLGRVQKKDQIKFVNILVDSHPPKLLSVSPLKSYYKNQDTITLNWHFVDDNPKSAQQVNVSVSYDNKIFAFINKEFLYQDELKYTITGISRILFFKIEAQDKLGNSTFIVKKAKIDSIPPTYRFFIKKISNILTVPYMVYFNDKGSGIKFANILVKKRDENGWNVIDTVHFAKSKRGIINFKDNGYYLIKVSVFDLAGNSSDDNKGVSFDKDILIDTESPVTNLASDRTEYFTGEIARIKLNAKDNIAIKNIDIALSKNNGPYNLLVKGFSSNIYEYKFKESGIFYFKFTVMDYAGNFSEKVLKLISKKPTLNFPCQLPTVIKEKAFSLPCKFDINNEIISEVNIYMRKKNETEFKEFAEYFADKEYTFPEGCYEVDIIGKDIQGNSGNVGFTSSSVCFIYTQPKINIIPPAKTIYNGDDSFIELKFVYESPALNKNSFNLEYSVDGGNKYISVLNNSNVIDTFKFSLSYIRHYEGFLSFRASIKDLADTTASYVLSNIYYDDILPRINFKNTLKKWYGVNDSEDLSFCVEDTSSDVDIKVYRKVDGSEYKFLRDVTSKCDVISLPLNNVNQITFKVVAKDIAGNAQYLETSQIFLDRKLPIVKLISSDKAKERGLNFQINVTDDESGVNSVIVYRIDSLGNEKVAEFKNNIPSGTKAFTYDVKEDGLYKFFAIAYDNVGNKAESEVVLILVDTVKPLIVVDKVELQKVHFCGVPLNLKFFFKDNIGIEYVRINIETSDSREKVLEKTIALKGIKEHRYEETIKDICENLILNIEAYDIAGNIETNQYTVRFEKVVPKITLDTKFEGWYSKNEIIQLKYCVEDKTDNLDIKLYQKTDKVDYFLVKEDLNKCDSVRVNLKETNQFNMFKIIAKNATGNTSYIETPKLFVDSIAPHIRFVTNDKSRDKTIKFNIDVNDNESGINNVIIYRLDANQNQEVAKFKDNIPKEFSYRVNEDGVYKFLAKVYDNVSNSAESNILEVLIDTTKPTVFTDKEDLQNIHLCGIPVNLKFVFKDNVGLEYIKVNIEIIENKQKVIDKNIRLSGIKEYIYEEVINNICDAISLYIEVYDLLGNVESGQYTMRFERIIPRIAFGTEFKNWYSKNEIIQLKYCVEDKTGNLDIKLYQKTDKVDYFLIKEDLNKCDSVRVNLKETNQFNMFKIIAKNATGNTSYIETPKLFVDSIAPHIALRGLDKLREKNIKFNLKAEDSESGIKEVSIYKIENDKLEKIFNFKDVVNSELEYTVEQDGIYKFIAKAIDNVGNEAQTDVLNVLVHTAKPIIDISKIDLQKNYFCGLPINLKVAIIDDVGLDYVKLLIDKNLGSEVVVDKVIKLNGLSKYIFDETLTNIFDNCQNYRVNIEAKDLVGNVADKSFNINVKKPALNYRMIFDSDKVKVGNIPYKIDIPESERDIIDSLEIFGKKEINFISFGKTSGSGFVNLTDGCYEFAVIGCLKNNICGGINNVTKICVYDVPKIEINFVKSYDVYSDIKKIEFAYRISNFKTASLYYSLDAKEYKKHSDLKDSDIIVFSIPGDFEGIVTIRLKAENILNEKSTREFQVKIDNMKPEITYEWKNLKSIFYPDSFTDGLNVKCVDRFLGMKPLTIFYRIKENDEFKKIDESDAAYTTNWNFSNFEKIQFKFICKDLGGNITESLTPFYIFDGAPPQISCVCSLTKKNNMASLNINYNVFDSGSGIQDLEISLYKEDKFYNLLYKGIQTQKTLNIDLNEEGNFFVQIFAKDNVNNSIRKKIENCTFLVDLTSPKLSINLPSVMKYPHNKLIELVYKASDNVKVEKIELFEILGEQQNLLSSSISTDGIFKIPPENKEGTRSFKLVSYDTSKNVSSVSFSVLYRKLELAYKINNESYITENSFNINYDYVDDSDLIEDVYLYYKKESNNNFIKYSSVLGEKKVFLVDGCYYLAVISKSKFDDTGDVEKFKKRICIVTSRPKIQIQGETQAFYGKEFVKIPYRIESLELDDNSIKIYWSKDFGFSWKKIDKKFKSEDEIMLYPEYEGQIYLKIFAKNKAGLENELVVKNIFISSKPPICIVEDKLLFNTKKVSFNYRIEENFIPTKQVTVSVFKGDIQSFTINKSEKSGTIETELYEGEYKVVCTVFDFIGNFSSTSIGNLIVDYTNPTISIANVEIKKIVNKRAFLNISYEFRDNIFQDPAEVELFIYDFTKKIWIATGNFKNVSRMGQIEITVDLFGKYSIAIGAKDGVGNRFVEDYIEQNKPSKYTLNVKKPRPKVYKPVKNYLLLSGEGMDIRYNCHSEKSLLAESVDMFILDENRSIVSNVVSDYPIRGEHTHYPVLDSGKYLLLLVCKSKYGIEFKSTKRFYIIDKLPKIQIKPN